MLDLPHADAARPRRMPRGGRGKVFAHLPIADRQTTESRLAATACRARCATRSQPRQARHARELQRRLRHRHARIADEQRPIFGPYAIDAGTARSCRSVDRLRADRGRRTSGSRSCARRATRCSPRRSDPAAKSIGALPGADAVPGVAAQRLSRTRRAASRATCRRSTRADRRIASVLGEPREALRRHVFLGGNFFMLRMLNRFRAELGVEAPRRRSSSAAAERRCGSCSRTPATCSDRRARQLAGGRAHRRRRRHEPHRAQVPDRLSIAPRVAARHRARRVRPRRLRIGRAVPVGRDRRQRQRRRRGQFEPHYREITQRRPGADLRVDPRRPARRA